MDLVARHHADEMDAFEIQRLQVSTSCVRTSRVGDLELSEIKSEALQGQSQACPPLIPGSGKPRLLPAPT